MVRAAAIVVALLASANAAQSPITRSPIFRFSTDEFWLNLHHFLYVLGRAEAKMPDASREAVVRAPGDSEQRLAAVTDDARQAWREATAFYATGLSRKDAVFDDPLPSITHALADAGDRLELGGVAIDPALRSTLERAAPVYRKAWWPAHRTSNLARRDEIQTLVDRHGAAVLAFIERVYGMKWPAGGYPVHLSGYANWAGAYSTTGNLLVVSSLDGATRGFGGLETVFHEGMHQWDRQMNDLLFAEARKAGKRLPPNVSHSLIFFTAGQAVRRVSPDHVASADANGVWERGFQRFRAPLEEVWKPYLDGNGTRDEAIAAFVARVAADR
jgi:hypothetical protein